MKNYENELATSVGSDYDYDKLQLYLYNGNYSFGYVHFENLLFLNEPCIYFNEMVATKEGDKHHKHGVKLDIFISSMEKIKSIIENKLPLNNKKALLSSLLSIRKNIVESISYSIKYDSKHSRNLICLYQNNVMFAYIYRDFNNYKGESFIMFSEEIIDTKIENHIEPILFSDFIIYMNNIPDILKKENLMSMK